MVPAPNDGASTKDLEGMPQDYHDSILTNHAQNDVKAKWNGLHMNKAKSIKKYRDHFWIYTQRLVSLKI